jgi:hypothetical protein
MADFIDRISGLDANRKLNLHGWAGVQRLYALGVWTRAQIAAGYDISGIDEVRQATQIADAIDSQSNATNRMFYILRVEAVLYCVEDHRDRLYHDAQGVLNKSRVYLDLQIAG